jgi:O-antigen ligase
MASDAASSTALQDTIARTLTLLRASSEILILALVILTPWAFGAADAVFEFVVLSVVGVLLASWGLRIVLEWRLTLKKCPVTVCLAALFLFALWQLTPLSPGVLQQIAPGTAQFYAQLLPQEPEVLSSGQPLSSTNPAPGSTISLYPGGTRQAIVRVLAVLALFVMVRNSVDPSAGLRRLSIVAFVNGVVLSFVGLLQFFSSPHNVVYWSFPSPGAVFGPFINRNHFAFYINLCIGLGLGLLLYLKLEGDTPSTDARSHRRRKQRGANGGTSLLHGLLDKARETFGSLTQNPKCLWVLAGLVFMVNALIFSQSRGGFLALLATSLLILTFKILRSGFSRLGAVVVGMALTLGLLFWLGFGYVEGRLATIWKGDAIQESRMPLWSAVLPLVTEFPVWGTGFGTFPYLESLQRTPARNASVVYEHAENEYLEALLEGGLVRLLISLAAIALIFWLALRALRREEGRPQGGLVLGGVFAFSTMVIHNFGDFALHTPAVGVLATVLCAYLCGLGRAPAGAPSDSGALPPEPAADAYALRLFGLAPLVGATSVVLLGLLLYSEGDRWAKINNLRMAAQRLAASNEPGARVGQIILLDAAARLGPDYARVRVALARAHTDFFEEQKRKIEGRERALAAVETVMAATDLAGSLKSLSHEATVACALSAAGAARQRQAQDEIEQWRQSELLAGLAHYVQTRDMCPLMAAPHLRIAFNVSLLARAEPRAAYLRRVKLLVGSDPEAWFLCGLMEKLDGQPDDAWQSWERSLTLSDRFLPIIVANSRELAAEDMIRRLLPPRPDVLLAVAWQLHPDAEATAARQPFLLEALRLLDERAAPDPPELHLKGQVLWALGRKAEAAAAYRQAVNRAPRQWTWHMELAQLLFETGELEESRLEAIAVLRAHPQDAPARELIARIDKGRRKK